MLIRVMGPIVGDRIYSRELIIAGIKSVTNIIGLSLSPGWDTIHGKFERRQGNNQFLICL